MALNRAFLDREYPASVVYEVAREKIRDFALAIGDPNPLYLDPAAAQAAGHPDVVAPPTFLTTLAFRFFDEGPIRDPDFGLDWSLVVHGEQRFFAHRPVFAGDRLTSSVIIEAMRDAGRNEIVTLRSEVATEAGDAVATAHMILVIRGTAATVARATAR